jgi:hypothetical protein
MMKKKNTMNSAAKRKNQEALDPTTVTERLHLQTFLYAASWRCINQLARHFIVIKGRKCD